METQASQSKSASPLDYATFNRLRESKLRPPFDFQGLRLLKLQALRERDLRELYEGRAPYELLQNADDAGATKAVFVLTDEGLAFAHNGKWFSIDNFRSLAEGWSDKDPQQCIGHKGIGFRSVLDITPAPHLFRVGTKDFFGAKFTWALNKGHIDATLQKDPSVAADFADLSRHEQPYCPVMSIPGHVKRIASKSAAVIHNFISKGKYGDDFTTMFWFPADDPEINPAVLRDLGPKPIISNEDGRRRLTDFVEKEVSVLLPFLSKLLKVEVHSDNDCIAKTELLEELPQRGKEGEIQVVTNTTRSSNTISFYQMRFSSKIPQNIRNLPDTPKALKSMEIVNVVFSVCLKDGLPTPNGSSRLHVYFPTEEFTGVGFTIHGDFYVKPDRTRLMPGGYNEWLLKYAADKAANKFLTQLLDKYEARSVYSTLSPNGSAFTEIAKIFPKLFSCDLKERKEPFVATRQGLMKQDEVLLPSSVDEEGFWESNFSEVVNKYDTGKKAFFLSETDCIESRYFLGLTNVSVIQQSDLFKFISLATFQKKSAEWWYFCYAYMANNDDISRQPYEYFKNHKIIPCSDMAIRALADEAGTVICLPPVSDKLEYDVPDCFTDIFAFVDYELAKLIDDDRDEVSRWVLNIFHIPRFEASELLPRAIRNIVPRLFSGQSKISFDELIDIWIFIKAIISSARVQPSDPSFWREIGRLPILLSEIDKNRPELNPHDLCPAFLAYWPDALLPDSSCVKLIPNLRRINKEFFDALVSKSNVSSDEWRDFLDRAGISANSKILKYSRVIGRKDLSVETNAPKDFEPDWFLGERQFDENIAVVQVLKRENKIWRHFIDSIEFCSHDGAKVVNTISISEIMGSCVKVANDERNADSTFWENRLLLLMKDLLPFSNDGAISDSIYCFADRGHSILTPSYLKSQMRYYQWLPSTRGPVSIDQCYIRHSSHRLISKGRTEEELGDLLIPYLVIDNLDELGRLQRFGFDILEDAASADKSVLIRALKDLGAVLSTDWGQQNILNSRGRWRLVRGAIQEIFSALNRADHPLTFSDEIKLPVKSKEGICFKTRPFYYAEPGSAVEQAFIDTLPLIDADRAYRRFFEALGIARLDSSDVVSEEFKAEDLSIPWNSLRDEIVNGLGPYYLALIKTKADRPKHDERVIRRLKEKFEVRLAKPLTVSFSLKDDPTIERSIDFPIFYLQRRREKGSGAIEENHYVLYVHKDEHPDSISSLDADALGAELTPLFLDGITDELAAYFPRISSRYQNYKGDHDEMMSFLYRQLGISIESLETSVEQVVDDSISDEEAPPPTLVVRGGGGELGVEEKRNDAIQKKHHDKITEKIKDIINPFFDRMGVKPRLRDVFDTPKRGVTIISPEQEERGRRGEEEIKRRLMKPGGWFGLILIKDVRRDNCGYDFLCRKDEKEVFVEIKTFTRNGRVFVTSKEMQVAAKEGEKYYLIGVLDEREHNQYTDVKVVVNPIEILLKKGEFDAVVQLQIEAKEIFTKPDAD